MTEDEDTEYIRLATTIPEHFTLGGVGGLDKSKFWSLVQRVWSDWKSLSPEVRREALMLTSQGIADAIAGNWAGVVSAAAQLEVLLEG